MSFLQNFFSSDARTRTYKVKLMHVSVHENFYVRHFLKLFNVKKVVVPDKFVTDLF